MRGGGLGSRRWERGENRDAARVQDAGDGAAARQASPALALELALALALEPVRDDIAVAGHG